MALSPSRPDTRAAIVEAAAGLLRDHGAAAVTTRAVAEAAGVQAPMIYRLFGDKDGLVDAVAEHVLAAYVAAKREASGDEADPVASLRAGWHSHVDFCLANPHLVALLGSARRDSPARNAGADVLRGRIRRIAAAGLLRVDEARAYAMLRAAGTGTVELLLATPAEERDPALVGAMFDTVAAGILRTAPATSGADALSVTVTFATVVDDLPALTDPERELLREWLRRALERLR